MRIVVDLELCQGHGVCETEAPELFEVPKHGKVRVLAASPPEAQRAALALAVKYCPTQALRVEED